MTIDIKAIRARAAAATEGPWEWRDNSLQRCGDSTVWVMFPAGTDGAGAELVWSRESGNVFTDATFIAHARADVPALCDEVERLREAIKRHRADVWGEGKPKHPADEDLYAALEGTEAEPTRLRAENERLRELLERVQRYAFSVEQHHLQHPYEAIHVAREVKYMIGDALEGSGEK